MQISHVSQIISYWLPIIDHHIFRSQLPGRVQQQGGHTQVREQRDEHSPIQLLAPSVLVAQLHGCFHLVAAIRGREGHRNVGQRVEHLLRR